MHYQLDEDGAPGKSVANASLASNHAAIEWAKEWLSNPNHAAHDRYTIHRDDGRFSACLIRTVCGQWYVMPKTGFLVAE